VGTLGSRYPHHHSFIQFPKNHPRLFFEYAFSKACKGRNHQKTKTETIPGVSFKASVSFFSGDRLLPALFASQRADERSTEHCYLSG
jgi:hypothetical protein